MPLLRLECNKEYDNETCEDFVKRASQKTSEILGKPESYVMCIMEKGKTMSFAGTTAPLAYVEFKSIGLPENKTAELSAELCQLIESQLGIPTDRIYIEFANAQRHMWGWDNRTF